MALETRRAREQEIRPVLEFVPKEIHSEIVNFGRGPGRRLSLKLELHPAGLTHRVTQENLPPGEGLAIPKEPFSTLRDRDFLSLQIEGMDIDSDEIPEGTDIWEEREYPYERLTLQGKYEDIWGNTRSIEREYDVWSLVEGRNGTTSTGPEPNELLFMIARRLNEIQETQSRGVTALEEVQATCYDLFDRDESE